MHLFWQCEKTTIFWQNLSLWLQSCQILTTENNLHLETALGLKPDSSNFKLQINFCCLLAKQYIWICRLRKLHPTQNNFLIYPIAYASRALTETEAHYAQMEKEMLAIVFAVEKFNDYTFGNKTIVFSDHKPLESILKPLHRASKHLQGMIIRLQKYDLKVR